MKTDHPKLKAFVKKWNKRNKEIEKKKKKQTP